MLKPTDKLYIKGFKIYRSNSDFRKGTLILVSNLIDAHSYMTSHSEKGRYVKVKLKNETNNFEYTMPNIYVEPDKETIYNEVMLSNIFESDIIEGDMNKSQKDLKKDTTYII